MPMTLKQWRVKATPVQLKQLAKRAKTSLGVIQQLALGFRGGSAAAAIRISGAAESVKGGPGKVDQASICPACKSCKFYKAS